MMKKINFYIASLLFAAATTLLFFVFLYRENISIWATYLIPIILFSPILIGLKSEINISKINLFTVFGFIIGFISASLINEINIWPIALGIWLIKSVPGILLLNFITVLNNRTKS